MRTAVWLILAAGSGAVAGTAVGNAPFDPDPWQVLAEVRDQLRADSPLETRFTQSFVPSGFSTGDRESGALYVDLPRCLRFEYREPLAKDYLLCGDWVYTWNPGEASGRRFLVNDSEAEGLDLLRLEVEALKTRYRAELAAGATDRTIIRLVPKNLAASLRQASVEVERRPASATSAGSQRLLALAYQDRSGNETRFEIADSRRLASRAEFTPPRLEWLEE